MLSRRTKRVALGLSFGLLALALLFTIIHRYFAAVELQRRLEEERADIRSPVPLIHVVGTETEIRTRRYAAQLLPVSEARVSAELAGRIEALPVEIGDEVGANEVFARLDDTLARLNLRTAETRLAMAEAQLREQQRRGAEAEELAATRVIATTELKSIQAQVEIQERDVDRIQAEIEHSRELLSRHEIRAPFSGVIGERLVEEGDTVSSGQPILHLVNLDSLRVVFFVSEREIGSIPVGASVRLELPSLPGRVFHAEVRHRAPAADRRTGSFRVEAFLDNREHQLPGRMRGTVEAEIQLFDNHLFVPTSAVRYEGTQTTVFLYSEEETGRREIPVEIGAEIRGKYPVFSGLNAGDRIIIQ